jgi:hypothetical protein
MGKLLASVPRSWREIGREIAIVFVGVLIALYAQQVVDNWQWRAKVRTAEAAMQRELFIDNGPQVYGRAIVHPCLQQRLAAIRTAVDGDRSRAELAALIDGVHIDFTSYDNLAVQSALASDVAAHMPQDRLHAYIQAYQMMPAMDRTNALEADDLARLRSLPRTGGPLSQEEKSRVLEAVDALRTRDRLMFIAARWTLPTMRKLGGQLDPARKQRFVNFARYYYGACAKDLPPDWAPQSPFHPDNYRPGRPVAEE